MGVVGYSGCGGCGGPNRSAPSLLPSPKSTTWPIDTNSLQQDLLFELILAINRFIRTAITFRKNVLATKTI